jgi:hypothetical protein
MDRAVTTIYVSLKNEGTDCWRPVEAESAGDNTFRIVSVNVDPDDQEWEFCTGDLVRCEPRVLSGGLGCLVAVERLPGAI